MSITIMCPSLSCRCLLRVPDKVRGKKVRCGQCGIVFSVPAAKGVAPVEIADRKRAADSPPKK
jgi:transcription elongation factor Elf1